MKNKINIVIIDDNKIDCFITKKIISLVFKNTYSKVFNSGINALEYFSQIQIDSDKNPIFCTDLILLDINMPLMSGFEFLNKLSKMKAFKKNPIEVYFLSSSNNKEDLSKAEKNPYCSGYINKPLSKDKLNRLIKNKTECGNKFILSFL